MRKPAEADIIEFDIAKALRTAEANLNQIHQHAMTGVRELCAFSIQNLKPDELADLVRRLAEFKLTAALSSPGVVAAVTAEAKAIGRDLTSDETKAIVARIAPAAFSVKLL